MKISAQIHLTLLTLTLLQCRRESSPAPALAEKQALPETTMPALEWKSPNYGIVLRKISIGQHINCGVGEDGSVVAWGVGDYVEAPEFEVKRIVCRDGGNATTTPDATTFEGESRNPLTLVKRGFELREANDVAIVSDSSGTPKSWSLAFEGGVTTSITSALKIPGQFNRISGGEWGACGLRRDGTMFCERAEPMQGTLKELSVGGRHVCAIDLEGKAACGGSNSHGQAAPPKDTFVTVSAGRYHTCGLTEAGKLVCWGAGTTGESCREPAWDCAQSAPPKGKWTTVGSGAFHTCALAEDGRVACWGRNERGQATAPQPALHPESELRCGLGEDDSEGVAPLYCWNQTPKGSKDAFKPEVVSMEGAQNNLCILLKDGRAACLRGGPESKRLPPLRVPDVRFSSLHADDKMACGNVLEGEPLCFTVENWALPPWAAGAKEVFPAPMATLALMPDGHIEVRGHEWAKQKVPAGSYKKLCGGGQWRTDPDRPQPIDRRQVHACGLSESGGIYCWGHLPERLRGNFLDMVCGANFVCGLTRNRNLECVTREGSTERSEIDRPLRQISSNGLQVKGATEKLDEEGYGTYGVIISNDASFASSPPGEFLSVWNGAGIHCGLYPDGHTACWGEGKDHVRAPKQILPAKKSRTVNKP